MYKVKPRGKYRIWDKMKKDYYQPTYLAYMGKLEYLVLNPSGDLLMVTNEDIHGESTFPDRFIVEHSTGISDEMNVEIHDGDLVVDEDQEWHMVSWDVEGLQWLATEVVEGGPNGWSDNLSDGTYTVIGNRRSHPYLFNKQTISR